LESKKKPIIFLDHRPLRWGATPRRRSHQWGCLRSGWSRGGGAGQRGGGGRQCTVHRFDRFLQYGSRGRYNIFRYISFHFCQVL